MKINHFNKLYIKLRQLSCLSKNNRRAIASLPLSIVFPLTSMYILVGSHALPKNKLADGSLNFFGV